MQKVIICLLGALCTARGQQFCTASCTDDVWNAIAVRPTESATCGDRIEWMMSSGGGSLTELDACQFIAEENPICAPCAPNPIPPPAPTPYSTKLDVASYNIPMWNDVNGNGYTQLWPKLQSGTFDLIGFQESDIQRILSNVPRMNDWGFIGSTPGGPSAGVSLAWDNLRFEEVPGGSGFTYITTGPYAARYVGYARLVDRESGSTIFFANTHGPHIGCPTWLGESWLSVVTDNIASGDLVAGTRIENPRRRRDSCPGRKHRSLRVVPRRSLRAIGTAVWVGAPWGSSNRRSALRSRSRVTDLSASP
mmetsp:Transcript_17229/g.50963  ORF Transcript_17229/g.50963 Transcript_17229/m.50963 type:complete len:307 (+) Transcript_17229:132-1052(+)